MIALFTIVILLVAAEDVVADVSAVDAASRFQRVRTLIQDGVLETALIQLESLRNEYPSDVDYAFARAQVLTRLGRDDAALEELRQAVLLAPQYEDVWQLRYNLLKRRQDSSAQLEQKVVFAEVADRFPDAAWWQSPELTFVSSTDPGWVLLVGAGHENLDNNLPSWAQQFVELSRDLGPYGQYRVGAARNERFGRSDVTASLGGDVLFSPDWTAGVSLAFAGTAAFQPEHSYGAYLGKSLEDGWGVKFRYQRREYATATVGIATGSVEKYISNFRVAYALSLSRLQDGSKSKNHSLSLNWYYDENASIGIGLNTGDEVESIGPGQVLKTPVRGVSLNGRRKISERWGLNCWLGLHDQGDFYRRRYFGMAVSIRL